MRCGLHLPSAHLSRLSWVEVIPRSTHFHAQRPRLLGLEGGRLDKLGTRPYPLQWLRRLLAKPGHQDRGGMPPPKRVGMDHVPGTLITEPGRR